MADVNNKALYPGIGMPGGMIMSPASEYIGMGMQEYWNWVNNSVFYSMCSPSMKPFFNRVRNWDYWINGLVPTFHDLSKGVIPTHLAKSIVKKVAALIYGGGIMLESCGPESPSNIELGETTRDIVDTSLKFMSDWVDKNSFKEKLQEVIEDAAGLGTACLKLNASRGNLWVEVVPFNRSFYTLGADGEVLGATFYIRSFSKGNDNSDADTYMLCEERFYQKDDETCEKHPCVCYKIYRSVVQVNQFSPTATYVPWEALSKPVRAALKEAFPDIRIDTPHRMRLTDLGIYRFTWTPSVSGMPELKYGDSILSGIIKYLCQYDILSSIMDTEMYCGRPRVLASKAVTNRSVPGANYNSGLDSFLITEIETLKTEGEPFQFIQPEIRAEQLKGIRNTILENIATAIGISPSSFASYLQDNSNRTAREISSEESATTLFVDNKRDSISNVINKMFDAVLHFYGYTEKVAVAFSRAGQTNYTLLTENATKIYQAGGMSLEKYVRTVNPQMDEAQVQEEIVKIRQEQEQREAMKMNAMFGDMEYNETVTGYDVNGA